MVQYRPVAGRKADYATDADEPILERARRKVAEEGGSLRFALRDLRAEQRERARQIALAEAPNAEKLEDGSYKRVSSDPRWPFGIEGELAVAPYGLGEAGLPKTAEIVKQGPKQSVGAARKEARDIIIDKLNRLGCDPIAIMAELAMDAEQKAEVRLRAAAELASMTYPRLRSVDNVQREEKTVFVIAIPEARPADANEWLKQAEGARAIADATSNIIEGEVIKSD